MTPLSRVLDRSHLTFDEDCLTLNLWRSAQSADQKLPVMYWIYGGGYVTGSSAIDVYNGAELARKYGVLVVSGQLSAGRLWFSIAPCTARQSGAHDQRGAVGSDCRSAMGAGKHCRLWRRSKLRDRVWRIGPARPLSIRCWSLRRPRACFTVPSRRAFPPSITLNGITTHWKCRALAPLSAQLRH